MWWCVWFNNFWDYHQIIIIYDEYIDEIDNIKFSNKHRISTKMLREDISFLRKARMKQKATCEQYSPNKELSTLLHSKKPLGPEKDANLLPGMLLY